jgi:hypothetical protein
MGDHPGLLFEMGRGISLIGCDGSLPAFYPEVLLSSWDYRYKILCLASTLLSCFFFPLFQLYNLNDKSCLELDSLYSEGHIVTKNVCEILQGRFPSLVITVSHWYMKV